MTLYIEKVIRALLSLQRRCWEHGEAMQALYEIGDYDDLVIMAKEAIVMSLPDGRTCIENNDEKNLVTDPCCSGEALLATWKYTGDKQFKEAYDRMLEYALHQAPRSSKGVIYHLEDRPEFWLDSMYMMPPFLASAGKYDEAILQVDGYWETLFDEDSHLMHWIWDDGEKKIKKTNYRSICNGFAVAGMERVLRALPETMQNEKKELLRKIMLVADAMLSVAGPDGYSRDTYDDLETHVAMNGAEMLTGVLFRLLAGKLIDKSKYLPVAERYYEAFRSRVNEYGFVEDCARRSPYTKSSPNGQSFFLIMEAARMAYFENEKKEN